MKSKLKNDLSMLGSYLSYKIISRHRKGSGIDSPFIFDFVSKVLYDKTKYFDCLVVESIRSDCLEDTRNIPFEEFGAGSRVFKDATRRISDITKSSSISMKIGCLLNRIIKYYRPLNVVELGTSVGVGTLFLAKGNEQSTIHTVEANKAVLDIAAENSEACGCKNIKFYHGLFDDVLENLLELSPFPEFIYIDGNHTYDATIRYFKQIFEKMDNGFIIIDDIYWSVGMKRAWKEIKELAGSTIDLYEVGIVVVGNMVAKNCYRVRF